MSFIKSVYEENIEKAKRVLEKDFKPISDMRASKNYRMEIAKNKVVNENKISDGGNLTENKKDFSQETPIDKKNNPENKNWFSFS